MAIELSSESGSVYLEFEVYGVLTTEDLTQIVNHLDDDHTIQKISIEIATENPAILKPPNLIQKESTPVRDRASGDMTEQTVETQPEQPFAAEGEHQSVNPTETSTDHTPRLQTGSDPFAIMRVVTHHDGWIRTKEVADAIPTDWDVSEDALGSNLWSLEDRGLVEKRPYEEDNRQNEYRVTEIGEQVLKHAVERAENLQPI